LDRFVKHDLKPKAYLRYGDDFLLFETDREKLSKMRIEVRDFLLNTLKLEINPKSDIIIKAKQGLKFLGVKLWSSGRTLSRRNKRRISRRLNLLNSGSYWGVVLRHDSNKRLNDFQWDLLKRLF